MELIKYILAVIDKRIVKNDHSIKFNNNSYFLIDEDSNRQYIKAFDKNIYASLDDKIYCLEKIPTHQEFSENFDFKEKEVQEEKVNKRYIPPMNHPWKKASFEKYLEKMKHRS